MFLLANRCSLIVLVMNFYFCQEYQALAQRPPTGGAAPIEDEGINPAVYIAGGVVIGAATYLYIKSRSPKIPVASHLPDYLRSHQIMPNPDAIELMYALNPSLNNIDVIRSNKKLNLPSFPKLDQNGAQVPIMDDGSDLAVDLQDQLDQLESSKAGFEQMNSQNANLAGDLNMAKIPAIIQKVETELNSIEEQNESSNAVTTLLINDLVIAFNQTLQEINSTGKANPTQINVMQGIADTLSELLSETVILTLAKAQDRLLALAAPELQGTPFLYPGSNQNATDYSSDLFTTSSPIEINAPGNTMDFAFAVYMYSEDGKLITEGPEVQGKFIVRYVLPALKDFENAYHTIRTPATYAVASFPPAKMYFVVEDVNGDRMKVQYPTIDFREEFTKPQLYNEDKVIVVPLRISK